jgi:hypothetical protein
MPVMLSRGFIHVVDLAGGGEVLVGDGAVGDASVDEGHPHEFVAEHGRDGFEAPAAVDGWLCWTRSWVSSWEHWVWWLIAR